MSTNDIIKFITQQFVTFFNQPQEVRKKVRQEKKQTRPPFSYNWFGVIPMALSMVMKKKKL
ncbi:YqzE family protein [Peribacillus sp. SCS-37]|uniref:YqzE family protein n=1 Tax=Paraperibacillus esterisolvens TaxID=3115296 RepID=UPI003906ADEC